MPESLKALRRRLRSIHNTQQVTGAMEMVSAAKLRRAQSALQAARPFIRKLEMLLGYLAPAAEAAGHPLFTSRRVRRSTLVLFTADRGLCGSYNSNLIRIAEHHLKEHRLGSMDLICVGRNGANYFGRRNWPIVGTYPDFGGVLDRDKSNDIAKTLLARYLEGETDEIYLLYSTFISTSQSKPTYEKYLDLDLSTLLRNAPPEERKGFDYTFEPDRDHVFDALLPIYLRSKVFITLAESFTSEHSARMLAMNNATKNCEELISTLTLRLNKARQTSITSDLLDIVGGAEALSGGA
jgi:F-type H+-transporting ATPase subunit gamma